MNSKNPIVNNGEEYNFHINTFIYTIHIYIYLHIYIQYLHRNI